MVDRRAPCAISCDPAVIACASIPAFSARFLEVHDALVDPAIGIVRRLVDLPLQPDEAPLFIAAATCTSPQYFAGNEVDRGGHYRITANGAGFTREECLWSVLGEACERYASGVCPHDAWITATAEDLGPDAIDLCGFIAFDDAQYARPDFPWRPVDLRAPVRWARGIDLHTGAQRWVPARLVWMGCADVLPGEALLPQLSTGQGAGATLAQAIRSGLYEVVERDAFTTTWLLRYAAPAVDPVHLAGDDARVRLLARIPHLTVRVLDVTTDLGLPSFVCLVKPDAADTVAVGAATHGCARTALVKSMLEAHHTRNWTLDLARRPPRAPDAPIVDFEDHVVHYLEPAHFPKLDFLFATSTCSSRAMPPLPPVTAAGAAAHLEGALDALAGAGYTAYAVDTTPADLASIGLHTAKVLIPGLQPLHVGSGTEHRDRRRLDRVALFRGLDPASPLNSDPHPFP